MTFLSSAPSAILSEAKILPVVILGAAKDLLASLTLFLIPTMLVAQSNPSQLTPHSFQRQVTVNGSYLLSLPAGYGADTSARWPLVLFLHGSGERGTDLELVKRNGPPKLAAEGKQFPFILVAPQCPEGVIWSTATLMGLLDEIESAYRVDSDRVYVTGLSLGGSGTWNLALAHPERFAAIVPVCGRTDKFMTKESYRLRNIPVWVFHGAKDDIVPPSDSEDMVNALKRFGGNVKFTLYPDANHNSWDNAYNDPELFRWLLQQKRSGR